jgi:hypothetical protein
LQKLAFEVVEVDRLGSEVGRGDVGLVPGADLRARDCIAAPVTWHAPAGRCQRVVRERSFGYGGADRR